MDHAVKKIAVLRLPGVILLIAMATTSFTGAAVLGVIGIAANVLSKFGLEALLMGVYKNRSEKGETLDTLKKEISGLFISDNLKRKLQEELGS